MVFNRNFDILSVKCYIEARTSVIFRITMRGTCGIAGKSGGRLGHGGGPVNERIA